MENNSKEKNDVKSLIDTEKHRYILNKKTIFFILALIISIIILLFLSYLAFQTFQSQACQNSAIEFAQNNRDTIFSIDKITFTSFNSFLVI